MKVKLNTTLKFDEHLIPGGTILIDDAIPQVILDLVEQGSPHVTVIEEAVVMTIDHDELEEIIADPDKIEDNAEEVVEDDAEEVVEDNAEEVVEDDAEEVVEDNAEDAPKLKRRGK